METLTLIRHAITDWNETGRFQGHADVPLNELGRDQARRLARRASAFGEVTLVTSPSRRARETARIAFEGTEPVVDDRLMELDFGVFEGRTLEENRAHPEWKSWFADPFGRPAPGGGERYRDLRDRAAAWLDEARAVSGGPSHVVAVTHSGTIQMLLSYLVGVEHPRWRKRFYLRHTGISRVVFRLDEDGNGGHAVVERVNDAGHLAGDGDPFLE